MIYVDSLQPTLHNSKWHYDEGCHLLADTVEELHAFADRLGLKRSWFQNPQYGLPHYDLTAKKRRIAVIFGASEISMQKVVQMMKDRRALINALSGIP